MLLIEAVVDAGAVRCRSMLLTAMAVDAGATVILSDPVFKGLALALMAGEIATGFAPVQLRPACNQRLHSSVQQENAFHSMLPRLLAATAALFLATLRAIADDFDSDGVKIHYEIQGTGEPVILIHGLHASAQLNWGAPGIIADLARHYRVIALDCRGHGQSGKPMKEGEYGEKMVGDVVRLIDHLHLPSAHLVGYSMGGMVSLKLAATHPERVRSAILGGMGWMQEGSPLQRVWEDMGRGNRAAGNPALLHGFAEFAVTAAQVKALKTPIEVIVGERDPCRRMYVAPLLQIRPEIPEHIITGAGHLACVIMPEFKAELNAALERQAAAR